jgi:hypothetical protein
MFHSLAIFRRKRQTSARYELPVMLQMSEWSEGETVLTSTVVMALLYSSLLVSGCRFRPETPW